jgi:methionyl-tRNA formyltransferase
MRAVFVGTVEFSRAALIKLISLKAEIAGVVTMGSSPFHADFADLSTLALESGIPCLKITDINSQPTLQWIRDRRPNVVFCFGFSQLLKKEALTVAPMGVIGYHPAKLPKNRGRHPIIWALALGLSQTASTFFFMDEGADSGDILCQEEVSISLADTARTLYDKITTTALRQMAAFLPTLEDGTCSRTPQDASMANYLRKRTKDDGRIDFRMSARAVYNLIRALTKPYPGAHVCFRGTESRIWSAQERSWPDATIEPGKVLGIEERKILVKCYDNAILLTQHEFNEIPKVGDYLQ